MPQQINKLIDIVLNKGLYDEFFQLVEHCSNYINLIVNENLSKELKNISISSEYNRLYEDKILKDIELLRVKGIDFKVDNISDFSLELTSHYFKNRH